MTDYNPMDNAHPAVLHGLDDAQAEAFYENLKKRIVLRQRKLVEAVDQLHRERLPVPNELKEIEQHVVNGD